MKTPRYGPQDTGFITGTAQPVLASVCDPLHDKPLMAPGQQMGEGFETKCTEGLALRDRSNGFCPRIWRTNHAQTAFLRLSSTGWKPLPGHGEPNQWYVDGQDGAKYYDQDFTLFLETLGYKSLHELLLARRYAGKTNHVLDLFGSGFCVEDQTTADSITGIRWESFLRKSDRKDIDCSRLPPTPPEILGDALNPITWAQLDLSMQKRGIPAFDLVTMRPVAGWSKGSWAKQEEQNSLAIALIVENVLPRLSPSGQFFFSIDLSDYCGDLTKNNILQALVKRIETETDFRLFLRTRVSSDISVSGVLYPKSNEEPCFASPFD